VDSTQIWPRVRHWAGFAPEVSWVGQSARFWVRKFYPVYLARSSPCPKLLSGSFYHRICVSFRSCLTCFDMCAVILFRHTSENVRYIRLSMFRTAELGPSPHGGITDRTSFSTSTPYSFRTFTFGSSCSVSEKQKTADVYFSLSIFYTACASYWSFGPSTTYLAGGLAMLILSLKMGSLIRTVRG